MLLTIKNFQSIENVTLELTGFTVIEGKSNSERSSQGIASEIKRENHG